MREGAPRGPWTPAIRLDSRVITVPANAGNKATSEFWTRLKEILMAGNYRGARRIAVGVAVASMVVLLAGCGTDPGGARPAATGPQAGSRAQAEMFARQLMARFAVPAGARPARLSPVPLVLRDPWTGPAGSSAPGSVDLGQLDMGPLALPATKAFMLTHEPSGADLTGTGQANSPDGVRELYIRLGSRSLPPGINDAEAAVLMVPRGAVSTLISIYVHVLWFPSRTETEHLDAADFGAVTISAVVYGAKLHRVTRTFSSATDIAALTGLLNGLPAAPDTTQSCPASNTFQIGFDPRTAGQAEVVVTTYGCYGATVTSRGIPQPALLDTGNAVAAAAARMLGVSAG